MSEVPYCPPHYYCSFTPQKPYVITHYVGPFTHLNAAGVIVICAGIAAICLLVIVGWVDLYKAHERRVEIRAEERQRTLHRAHELEIAKQRTYQADAAKGNPEILKILRDDD